MTDELRLHFAGRLQWRSWLKTNHKKVSEVWLVFFKKAAGKPGICYNEAVEEALCYGWINGKKKAIDPESYAHRFTPRKAGSSWSELNIKRVRQLLASRKMCQAGIEAFKGHETRTNSPAPGCLSGDLQQMLEAETVAWNNFSLFSQSYQRICIRWIMSAKQKQTQLRRLDCLIKHAAENRKIKFM